MGSTDLDGLTTLELAELYEATRRGERSEGLRLITAAFAARVQTEGPVRVNGWLWSWDGADDSLIRHPIDLKPSRAGTKAGGRPSRSVRVWMVGGKPQGQRLKGRRSG